MRSTLFSLALLLLLLPAAAEERFHETPSGLKYEIMNTGDAEAKPTASDIVEIHYVMKTKDGKKLESSRDRGQSLRFFLGQGPEKALGECVALMGVGARYKLYLPKARAQMPIDQDVIIEIELISIIATPRFTRPDPQKQVATASGLKYEVVKGGEGTAPTPDQNVRMRFAFWNTAGELVICTEAGGRYVTGKAGRLGLAPGAPLPFLAEAAALMKPGSVYRFEVLPKLCFGDQVVSPKVPANTVTFWELELIEIVEVPVFKEPDKEKLVKTESGLAYEVIKQGDGAQPTAKDTVTVHYMGWFEDGKSFDSSYSRGEPAVFPLNRVIRGWTEGLQLMKVGSVYKFVIPWDLAYGERGSPPTIPPKANLIFQVELIKIGK